MPRAVNLRQVSRCVACSLSYTAVQDVLARMPVHVVAADPCFETLQGAQCALIVHSICCSCRRKRAQLPAPTHEITAPLRRRHGAPWLWRDAGSSFLRSRFLNF